MLGIDKRLIVKSTSQWLIAGIVAGITGVLLSLALYTVLGLGIDGLLKGEAVVEKYLPVLIGLLAAKLAAGWFFRFAQYRASSQTKLSVRDMVYEHALRLGPRGARQEAHRRAREHRRGRHGLDRALLRRVLRAVRRRHGSPRSRSASTSASWTGWWASR